MPYDRVHEDWLSGAAGNTPITEAALDQIEAGLVVATDLAEEALGRTVQGLRWNDYTASVRLANTNAIQDSLSKYGTAHIPYPPRDEWLDGGVGDGPSIFERLVIDDTVQLASGQSYRTPAADKCQLTVPNGHNLDAIIASKNWYDSSGSPSSEARGITIDRAGVDGNWLERQAVTPTELQTGGLGHGIAVSAYASTLSNNLVSQVRGDAYNVDTTGRDGSTFLGECIEMWIMRNRSVRSGRGGIRAQDTAAGNHGVTDFFVAWNVLSHMNIRANFDGGAAYQDQLGAAIFTDTAGGWVIIGNHIYAADVFGGNYSGYPASGVTHGMVLLTANGTRVIGNQIADYGYHPSDNSDSYGLWLRQFGTRPSTVALNNAWTDEDGIAKTRYAYRLNMSGTDDVAIKFVANEGESRVGLTAGNPGTPTANGLLMNGQGTIRGAVALNDFHNMGFGDMFTAQGNVASNLHLVRFLANSWDGFERTVPVTIASNGALTVDARDGATIEVTLDADITSHSISGVDERHPLVVLYQANGATRGIDFTGFPTSSGITNPGDVLLASGGIYRAVFVRAFGTTYLHEAGQIA